MKTNEEHEKKETSYSFSYDTLINLIIRPPRSDNYNSYDLSDKSFIYNQKEYTRTEYVVMNKLNKRLKCSFFEPCISNRPYVKMPVVIYLHGNASSREEGMFIVPSLLKNNINVFLFDFSGSGLSDGDYISLGYNEKDDLESVVNFVSKLKGVSQIGIWGRSMGAATALMYVNQDKRIKACVFDSSYADFNLLVKEICKNTKGIPGFLCDFAMHFVKKTIKDKYGFEIEKLKPIEFAEITKCPAFFVHAVNDSFIPIQHTLDIYEKYGGNKSLNICSGGHNTKRDKFLLDKIVSFFSKYLYKTINPDRKYFSN